MNTAAERKRNPETENKSSSLGGLTEHLSLLSNVQTLQTTFWILKIDACIV